MPISVKNLKYVYNPGLPGETVALSDVSFDIQDGTTVGIIGHTGSGKSTLLQHLNGLIKPTSGEVWVDGVCITDGSAKMTDIRRRVGLVFQYPEYQLFEETVAKDVAFGPKNIGLDDDEIRRRVEKALSLVGLDCNEIGEVSPFELSGGQKRRVAIAGVLAMKPSVLILDEPTAGLDPAAHREILAMINNIRKTTGSTVIFVSHNMADIAMMSDRVIVMNSGHIELDGTPAEVFAQADKLASMDLAVPPAREIVRIIKSRVQDFDSQALTIDEAAEDIRKYMGYPAAENDAENNAENDAENGGPA